MSNQKKSKTVAYTCIVVPVAVANGIIGGISSVITAYFFKPVWNKITKLYGKKMIYVKFISKENEWFDAGTEVFDATICDWGRTLKRMTKENYENTWIKAGHILGRGLRNGLWDEELCPLEEFEISYTEEQI